MGWFSRVVEYLHALNFIKKFLARVPLAGRWKSLVLVITGAFCLNYFFLCMEFLRYKLNYKVVKVGYPGPWLEHNLKFYRYHWLFLAFLLNILGAITHFEIYCFQIYISYLYRKLLNKLIKMTQNLGKSLLVLMEILVLIWPEKNKVLICSMTKKVILWSQMPWVRIFNPYILSGAGCDFDPCVVFLENYENCLVEMIIYVLKCACNNKSTWNREFSLGDRYTASPLLSACIKVHTAMAFTMMWNSQFHLI